ELVLLRIEGPAGFEIDIGEPQVGAAADRLMLKDRGGAFAVHSEAVAVVKQVPAVPKIFVIAVARRPYGRPPAFPFAGHAVHRVGEKADLRAPFEHRDDRALRRCAVAVVAGRAAQEAEFGSEGPRLGRIGDWIANRTR